MAINVVKSGQACGATVTGADLSAPLDTETVAEIRAAWLEHHVLAFPDQAMTDDDLERFTLAFGGFGDDPFIAPIDGRDHVIAVERRADETSPSSLRSGTATGASKPRRLQELACSGCRFLRWAVTRCTSTSTLHLMPCPLTSGLALTERWQCTRLGAATHLTGRTVPTIRPPTEAWTSGPPTRQWPPNSTRLSASILKQDGY